MRHKKRASKLGVKSQHRRAMLANLVISLIEHNRIRTTIARAKQARREADKMVTLAKKGSLHHRRLAVAFLRHKPAVEKLFAELGKQHSDRQGGYTRIIRVGPRPGDAAEMAILEWTGTVVAAPVEPTKETPATETKPKALTAAKTPKPKAEKSAQAKADKPKAAKSKAKTAEE